MAPPIARVDPIRRGGGSDGDGARAVYGWPCAAVSQDPPRSQSRDRVSSLARCMAPAARLPHGRDAGDAPPAVVVPQRPAEGASGRRGGHRVVRLRVPGNRFSATWASFLTETTSKLRLRSPPSARTGRGEGATGVANALAQPGSEDHSGGRLPRRDSGRIDGRAPRSPGLIWLWSFAAANPLTSQSQSPVTAVAPSPPTRGAPRAVHQEGPPWH